ncbi:Ribosome biogenesis protein BMS1 [Fasciola hepatica]|uniref:Ribosome biogenesis protein BMS1 n=1 Tax=Fasciola hepatica TaxID=6192 RepID=A0A4E0REE8_FASHE|nr:Ribosome biogenesis protein BMS1 [Fasciola hepatica]
MGVQDDSVASGDTKKKHRARQSGPKAIKKASKSESSEQQRQNNPKAFAIQHTTKAARLVQRTLDYQTKKHHLPQAEHVHDAPPPMVVALVGPPQSGKTTLLKSLVKHFARQSINVVNGPLTVVVGKKMRLTFIECGCDINSMLDAAKIADIVLLMVNIRVGLEFYHFEFINMIQVHGMPRVIPILNHLDTFKDSSSSRALRRKIKQRLWVDLNSKIFLLTRFVPKKHVKQGEKFNEYSKPGDYLLAEVRRLARMLVVKVPHSTDWRTSHPYLLIDRLEDVTDPTVSSESSTSDRTVSMYGWVRGAPLPPALTSPGIHIAGVGDFTVADCTRQPDPCPLPSQIAQAVTQGKPTRHLAERDRKIYAPMSSLGGVLFDRDATYIDLGGSHYLSNHQSRGRLQNQLRPVSHVAVDQMHTALNDVSALDEQLATAHQVRILGDTPYLLSENIQSGDTDDSTSEETDGDEEDVEMSNNATSDKAEPSSDVDMGTKDTPSDGVNLLSDQFIAGFLVQSGTKVEEKLPEIAKKASNAKSEHLEVKKVLDDIEWRSTKLSRINWNKVIYGQENHQCPADTGTAPTSDANDLFTPNVFSSGSFETAGTDFTLPTWLNAAPTDWMQAEWSQRIANRFTTGQWEVHEDARTLLISDAEARASLAAVESEKYAAASASHSQYKDEMKLHSDDEVEFDDGHAGDDSSSDEAEDEESSQSEDEESVNEGEEVDPLGEFEKRLLRPTKRQKLLEKRKRHKELFHNLYEATGGGPQATAFYDKLVAAKEAQMKANKLVLDSLPQEAVEKLEGFPPGAYVRLMFKGMPYQFMERFNPNQPLVAGGIPSTEESRGFIQIRFRTHRWFKNVLRSNDPTTVSIGWRRYQTVCVFSKEEHNMRNRYLKYSLPHEHCLATVYGPPVPAKTGVVFFVNSAWLPLKNTADDRPNFRVAGTGSVVSTNQSFQIMKKLKLIGEPYKIFSKTAFIRNMFNSSLEVSKMVGSRIQTVSNIRGLIKAALTNPSVSQPGDFRATFEAPIRRSDLVFLRTFAAVDLPKYYNPVPNRLCPIEGDADAQSQGWRLLRTLTDLRRAKGIQAETRPDSVYKDIHRPVHVPTPLYVPTKLVAQLPFAQKPKPTRREAREMLGGDPVRAALLAPLPAPVRSVSDGPEGETRHDLLNRLRRLHANFKERQKQKMTERVTKHKKQIKKEEARKAASLRKKRKHYFAKHGKKDEKN